MNYFKRDVSCNVPILQKETFSDLRQIIKPRENCDMPCFPCGVNDIKKKNLAGIPTSLLLTCLNMQKYFCLIDHSSQLVTMCIGVCDCVTLCIWVPCGTKRFSFALPKDKNTG